MDEKGKSNNQEMIIDIHLKNLEMKVEEEVPLKVIWSRGQKKAQSHSKKLKEDVSIAVYDEKFQINTVLELDEDQKPTKEKMSKMTICLDKSRGGHAIGEVEFDMASFSYGEYKYRRVQVKELDTNPGIKYDPETTFIEFGLKGTKSDGLVKKRMSEIKSKMKSNLQEKLTRSEVVPKNQSEQSQELFNNIVKVEVDRLHKEAKERKKEY